MKALVTGSAGFVGRHLCPKLEALGYQVIGCDPKGSVFIGWELRDYLQSLPDFGIDLVVHLAANIVNVDARLRGGISMYDDIALDLAMCRWLEANPPKQCAVLMSSCAVDYPADPYSIVKRNLECFAQTLHKQAVPLVVLRPFSGYGEDQSMEYPFPAILARAMRREDPLTVWGGEQVRDWLHIDDLTDAILFAIRELPRSSEPIEVGTQCGTSLRDLAEVMAQQVGYLPTIHCDRSKPASSSRRVAGENGLRCLQEFGWTPKVSLRDGITRAFNQKRLPMAVVCG